MTQDMHWNCYRSVNQSGYCLTPSDKFFSYIMTLTSCFLMRWWWDLLCTRPIN